jgi:Mrp family chromosome partitioning ATPase/capsular polysaccharide biosynthesis protein
MNVLRRRRRVVITTLLVLPLASALFSISRPHVYQGSAEVLLTATNLPAALTGVAATGAGAQPDRMAATQADLARVPEVARRTLAAVGLRDRSPEQLLDVSSVIPKTNTDLLEINVHDRSSTLAERLANAYANQFTKYKRELDSAGLADALRSVRAEIASLQASGATGGAVYVDLLRAERQLATTAAVGPSNALVVRQADHAKQVEPRPKRALLLGLGLGVVLAIGLAFGLEGLDTRVRNDSEIWQELGLPLLARLPSAHRREWHETGRGRVDRRPRSRLADRAAPPVGGRGPAMVVDPTGPFADALRVLRANVDLVNVDLGARLIMVTSAMPDGERPIVSANLAVAFARAGRHVILVDLDLRKPSLARIFGLRAEPGVTDVVLGSVPRSRALAKVAFGSVATNGTEPSGNGFAAAVGRLEVLVAGHAPPDGSEFVGTHGLAEFLVGLSQQADLVVLDAPPMLSSGDAIALGAQAEALIAVVSHEVPRQALYELRRVLEASPAAKLGVVVTGVEDLPTHRHRRPPAAARSRQGLVATRVEWKRVAEAAASASRASRRVAGAAAAGSVRTASRLGKLRR